MSAEEAHALAISSTAICSMSVPVPVPPCSAEKGSARMSFSAKSLRMSCGYSPVASISAARGRTFSFTIWRIVSRNRTSSSGMS